MKMPWFTTEASLGRTDASYQMIARLDQADTAVRPRASAFHESRISQSKLVSVAYSAAFMDQTVPTAVGRPLPLDMLLANSL